MSAPMHEVVALAADHGGYDLKCLLLAEVAALGYEVLDLGTAGPEPVDYPAYAAALAQAIADGRARRGVLICG
ncbi:MAG TPA: RpiB/LacA/LacB family sugar-phosphate isomerase, partial [Stellaceae bacterium]|nr:RpiB/LacA/LacB family sugar-phosphate isomerase [Stellaceae bacterium]